jgi:hypothetical protein
MEKMPDGSIALTVGELSASVIAIHFSPHGISGSDFAKRLRQAEQAVVESTHDGQAVNNTVSEFQRSIDEETLDAMASSAAKVQKVAGIDGLVTIVPAEELALLEDSILNLLEIEPAKIATYIRRRHRHSSFNAMLYAHHFLTRADPRLRVLSIISFNT